MGIYPCISFTKKQRREPPDLLRETIYLGVHIHDPRVAYLCSYIPTRTKTMLPVPEGY